MEPQKEFSKGDSVYVSFRANSPYRGAIGILMCYDKGRAILDLGFGEDHLIGVDPDELCYMGWISYAKEWVLDKLPTILTILFVVGLGVTAYLISDNNSKPKPQAQVDQVLEIGKKISALQDRKYVQLSKQRELKRQLEASYMEVAKIDQDIVTKRSEMMELVNPSDSNLSIEFSSHEGE